VTAFLVIGGIILYLVIAFATGGYINYRMTVYPEPWQETNLEDRTVLMALGAMFWFVAWTIFIPGSMATRLARRIAAQGVKRRRLAEADADEVDRAMRELE
jgi:hypothetical protein